ncbi:MAG: radical SAM protein [Desulfurococcaceae archaeon]
MEINTVYKNPLRVAGRVAYIYPSIYNVMISSLAPDIIYSLVNNLEEVYMERFVNTKLQGPENEPRSIETGSRLRDFGLIMTTLHYEPDIVNLARILKAGGISVFRDRRKEILIAGGPVCMENPIPYSDIVDAFIIGEAEVTIPIVIEKWLEYIDNKRKFLEELSTLKYVYVPEYTDDVVEKRYVEDLDKSFYPYRQIENTMIEPVFGRGFKLEVSRGCRFWCSFCLETRVFQPYRERSVEVLKSILNKGIKYTISGKRVVIYSLSFPGSRDQIKLLEYLVREGYVASLPSLRLLGINDDLLEVIKGLGQRMLVFAPETFSHIYQRIFFKYAGLEVELVDLIKRVIGHGFNVKLYLIYGVKGEDMESVKINIRALRELARYAKSLGKNVVVSLNPLVPKPHTMFQWIGMETRERLTKILRAYKSELGGIIETRPYDMDWAIIQAQLSLSSEQLGVLIDRWADYGGGISGWKRAMYEFDIDLSYVYRGYGRDEPLPWGFIKLDKFSDKVTSREYEVYGKLIRAV